MINTQIFLEYIVKRKFINKSFHDIVFDLQVFLDMQIVIILNYQIKWYKYIKFLNLTM